MPATVEDIGKGILYYGEKDVFVGGDIIILKLDNILNPLYFSYLINSECIRQQKSSLCKGGIIVHIYSKDFRNMYFPVPNENEQKEIVKVKAL